MDCSALFSQAVQLAGYSLLSSQKLPSGINDVFLCRVREDEGLQLLVRVARDVQHVFWGDSRAKYRSEATAMRFARQLLSDVVYVPKVCSEGCDELSGRPFLCLEFVQGESLRAVLKKRENLDRKALAQRVVALVQRMASAKHESEGICGFEGTGLWFDGPHVGPCRNTDEFVEKVIVWSAEYLTHLRPDLSAALLKVPEAHRAKNKGKNESPYRIVFRHGDLSVDNFMVRGADDELVLVDWEWSGFMDERDVWLELRELLKAMGHEDVFDPPVPIDELEDFYDYKEIYMAVSYAAVSNDKQEELDVLEELLDKMGLL